MRSVMPCAVALLSALSVSLPAQADPPPWAPAHGQRVKERREYRYIYYPAQQVYYAPATRTWFWMSGGNWQLGVSLPNQVRVDVGAGGVPVVLHSSRPYVEHVYVERHYGRPWRAQHRHHEREWREERHGQPHREGRHD